MAAVPWIVLAVSLLAVLCIGITEAVEVVKVPRGQAVQTIVLQLDPELAPIVAKRISYWCSETGAAVRLQDPSEPVHYSMLGSDTMVMSIGNTTTTREALALLSKNYALLMQEAGPDGFFVGSVTQDGVPCLFGDGSMYEDDPFQLDVNSGRIYASYALLEGLGFGFFHPLDPVVPAAPLIVPNITLNVYQPEWPFRGWHYHTEHPLDLHEVLNGMSAPDATWEEMMSEVEMFFEWIAANRQNRLEYILLWTRDWDEFAWSDLRKGRLSNITALAHQFGIAIAADQAIAEKQQHAWYMTSAQGTLEEQTKEIHQHVDWIFDAGYDFIATESGYSEFTHPDCTKMLQWMNILTEYVTNAFDNKRVYIKCHCSTGQECPDYVDPHTGDPINFNFLPAFADPNLGVFPHTVQYYNLTEPAPTYGNTNFTYMLEFILREADKRDVVYHGESAYWVNYDINVPLFLPIYCRGRMDDLRLLAKAGREHPHQRILGQMNFESGWEWSYWIQNSVTARAAYNPQMQEEDDREALRLALLDVTRVFGGASADVADLLMRTIDAQTRLLVHGEYDGVRPDDVFKRNGMAYLEGWDTWTEIEAAIVQDACTQPIGIGINQVRARLDRHVSYETDIQPLLAAMEREFSQLLEEYEALLPRVPDYSQRFYQEIVDTMNVTAVRASQVFSAYDYAWSALRQSPKWRSERLATSAQGVTAASEIIKRREQSYRTPVERIASWRPNPTCYSYTYLWTAHSQYYFWRDYQKAANVSVTTLFPCFMNYNDPADTGFGPGPILNVSHAIGNWLQEQGFDNVADCLLVPVEEPSYPSVVVPNFPPPEQVERKRKRSTFGSKIH